MDVIRDGGRCEKLGIFVAPGAMGLYLGGLLAGKLPWLLLPVGITLALLLKNIRVPENFSTAPSQKPAVFAAICCFAGGVLRSLVGFQVVFPWKTGLLALLCFNMTMPLTLFSLWRRWAMPWGPARPAACWRCCAST